MFLAATILLFLVFSTKSLASLQFTTCHHFCTCIGTSAKCDVTDQTLSAVLEQLPNDLTKLELSSNSLTRLKKDTLRRFGKLVFLSLAENTIQSLENGCFNGLTNLKELDLRNNGKYFSIQDEVFKDTPLLTNLRLEGNPTIKLPDVLKTLNNLREISTDSWKTCLSCNYTKIPRNELCLRPGYCLESQRSPFGNTYCACAVCTRLNSRMSAMNCTDELPKRIMGDKTAVRVVLWVISILALVSNVALIVTRVYTHARRQRPLTIFIVGLALSNLFVTTSVIILLVADSHQSSKDNLNVLGQGNWSQSVCSPVYFLKHFGIYSLVIILTFIILERFIKLGYKLCFIAELSLRRSAVYICEAWVLSFLLIIPPWTRVTSWHKFCMASYEMAFAQVMYIICGLLVLGGCFSALVQVGLIFWRRILIPKTGTRKETRMDLRLILVGVLTFAFLGVPHGVITISYTSGEKTGTEIVTILLGIASLFYPLLLINYAPSDICLSDTLSTKNMECTCGKCNVEQFYPEKYSTDSLNPPKSPDTLASYPETYDSQQRFTKMTTSDSVRRMSADSLLDLDTWTSRSTKTKSWIESCDYEDLRKLQAQPWVQTPRDSSFREVPSKPRALTWSDRYVGKSTSTSGVNDVYSVASSSSECASTSSERARSSSERDRSSSDQTSSLHTAPLRHSRAHSHHEVVTRGPEIVTTTPESIMSNHDSESEKTSDRKRRSKRLSSLKDMIQRALSPKRQRSKSLPEKSEVSMGKVERSQSAPFTAITLDRTIQVPYNDSAPTTGISPESNNVEPSIISPHQKTGESTYMERLASFFILAPARSPKHPRKPVPYPGKAKPVGVVSPTPSQKSSVAERLVKSLSMGRKSPSHELVSPARIALEEGDILTELPVMRRQKLRTKPRDPMVRISTGSTGSTGSTTNRFSLEWDPIGSVEGYAEREVLPPYPPVSLKTNNGQPPSKISRPLSDVQTPEQPKPTERTSLYSLDWDPTSVQLRNSVLSRDSLSLGDSSDDEGHVYAIEDCEDTKGKTVWV